HASLIKEGLMKCTGCGECFVKKDEITGEDREKMEMAFRHASGIIKGGDHDVVILDEILNALGYGLLDVSEVVGLLKGKPEHVEVILTGRNAPPEIIEVAHLVTEMVGVKHPFKDTA
ncbi:MAG: cob(I)yrinic acid a,c-diamide adenosyltransferase, partial [Syntrophothermus sp.]